MVIISVLLFIINCSNDNNDLKYRYTEPKNNGDGWETSTLANEGINLVRMENMMDKIAATYDFIYSVIVIRNDKLVFEEYFNGMDENSANKVHSISKGFTSALTGLALRENYLSNLDQKMMDFFPEYDTLSLDPRKYDITLKHLLTMKAGFDWISDESHWNQYGNSPDWINFAINLPLRDNPGDIFNYCCPQSNLMCAILTKATGMSVHDFADQYLCGPLNINIRRWEKDPQGYCIGSSGIYISPRDIAKLGYLYLNNGVYNGKQIIPSEWIEESLSNMSDTDFDWGHTVNIKYGYAWLSGEIGGHDVIFVGGYGGQVLILSPDMNMITVFTTNGTVPWSVEGWQYGMVINLIADYIFPAAEDDLRCHLF